MALSVGTSAPDFTLRTMTSDGLKDVTLSDHKGKDTVVLLFYPGAFTHVCADEVCIVTNDIAKFQASNATVYGVSNDSPWSAAEWSKQLKIGFPLLSDFQHEVAQAYDVVWPNFSGLGPGTARAAIVIDKEGVIQYSEQTPTLLDLPDFAALRAAVDSLN
jgi:peroxiredoxin